MALTLPSSSRNSSSKFSAVVGVVAAAVVVCELWADSGTAVGVADCVVVVVVVGRLSAALLSPGLCSASFFGAPIDSSENLSVLDLARIDLKGLHGEI